ncbi:hypothetical protein IFR05_010546 [Cadophora sp. M221]|nr:hypothetical protein IFR05_010546 [Cadophora sp. M221]
MPSRPLTIGPPSKPWTYSAPRKTWDLSNSSSKKLTFPTTEGIAETRVTIDPEKTALVVVDMQNFFLDASCMDHPNGLKAVEPTGRVVEWCREVGIKVIWLNWGLTDSDITSMPASIQRGFMRDLILPPSNNKPPIYTGLGSDLGSTKGRTLFASTWNAAIYPPLTKHISPSDINVSKNRMSGLWNDAQPLWKTLVGEGVGTLMFAGVNTDQIKPIGQLVYFAGGVQKPSSYGFVTRSDELLAAKVG